MPRVHGWAGVLALVAAVALSSHAAAAAVVKRNVDNQFSLKDKRPFCNAFTGCGRKRSSSPPAPGGASDAAYESGADSRAELDELERHVLAQARLWEQLQKKVELMRTLASGYPEPEPRYRRKRGALRYQRSIKQEIAPPESAVPSSSLSSTLQRQQQQGRDTELPRQLLGNKEVVAH